MKETRLIMGMPVSVEIVDAQATQSDLDIVFNYFTYVDNNFSKFKATSELTALNEGKITLDEASADMKEVIALCEQTRQETDGYFDMRAPNGTCDPTGLVKGWAVCKAGDIIRAHGFKNFCVEAGGDMEISGHNVKGEKWRIGIRNPFGEVNDIVKVVALSDEGIATSGTYVRGQHIYNPHKHGEEIRDVVSLSVIGPNVYEADRFATAAFAMGEDGIMFIERLSGFEGYQINKEGVATMTTGFSNYVV
jgi:thiamine biosynthesis lipoprotein